MNSFDDKLRARARTEKAFVPEGFDARMGEVLNALPQRNMKGHRYLRTVLVAAAVCALLGVTAWAYVTGALDFLKGREEYQFLGRTEVYEKYAKPVNLTQTAENGDVLTIESMAMDGNFCTLIYKVETVAEMATWSDINNGISKDAPDFWQAMILNPSFHIEVGGDLPGWNGGQQFLADANTLYGMTRIALERPVDKGERFTLHVGLSLSEIQTNPALGAIEDLSDVPDKWTFDLVADPLETETIGTEVGTLSRSPLGTILTLSERVVSGGFALRDGDTGAYIPYSAVCDVMEEERTLYELYGDTSGLRTLEVVPIQYDGKSSSVTIPLEELPARGNNTVGGYEVSSVEFEADKIVVTRRPVGATTGGFGAHVSFVDANGEHLFSSDESFDSYLDIFRDWTNGNVIEAYSLGGVPEEYVKRIVGVEFRDSAYMLLEDQAITVPLT